MLGAAGLLVVDMQNGFCHQDGTVAQQLDISAHRSVVPRIASIVTAAHNAGTPVFWSRQVHFPDDATRARHRVSIHTAKLGYVPCLRGTWDAELLDELAALVGDDDLVFTKHRASGFYNTTLEVELRMRAIDTLIITGVSTSYCVDATIRDAYARDFDLFIVEDACAAPWQDLHDATMKNAGLFHGEVVSTDEVIETFASRKEGGSPGAATERSTVEPSASATRSQR